MDLGPDIRVALSTALSPRHFLDLAGVLNLSLHPNTLVHFCTKGWLISAPTYTKMNHRGSVSRLFRFANQPWAADAKLALRLVSGLCVVVFEWGH